jgi:gluconate 2-dehydrogenase gamma chain
MAFTPQELAILRAAVDRILPPDELPGAWEAGAAEYLGRLLEGDLVAMRAVVQAGLAALDAEAQTQAGSGFAALSPAAQDALLRDVETGAVRGAWPVSPAQFFDILVRTTAEGFYSDPAQGGNRGRVSWTMTGFEPDPA